MRTRKSTTGRHRLGMPGGVYCLEFPAAAAALVRYRRSWFASLTVPARHGFVTRLRRPVPARARWAPATAG